MITKFKIYESVDYPAIQFQDEYLIVHKVTEGPNKGLIKFKIYEESSERYSITYSTLYGAATLLDTKYENIDQIRDVKLENIAKFRKVNDNTVDAILYVFLETMGYKLNFYTDIIKALKTEFLNKIKIIAKNAKNLGDIFDDLRKIRDEVFLFQNDHFEEYQRNIDTNKYNL